MSDDLEGFDPGAAASGAMDALDEAAAPGDQPDRDASEDDIDDDRKDASDSDGSGVLATFVLPAFLADERGPTSETFQKHDIDGGIALILDGFTDYVLELVGKDVGDSLGPAGKVGLGFSRLSGQSSSKDRKESSDSDGSDDDDVDDPFDRSGASAV